MLTKDERSQEAPREKRVRLQKASCFLLKAFMIASLKSSASSAFGSNPGSAFDTSAGHGCAQTAHQLLPGCIEGNHDFHILFV